MYGDGQTWSGEIYQDIVQTDPRASVAVDLVAIASQNNFFGAGQCGMPSGILGLGPDSLLLPGTSSYLAARTAAGMADQLAMHYCTSTGMLWLGGFDPTATTSPPRFVPMQSSRGYSVNLVDLLIDGTGTAPSPTGYGAALVDSGGPYMIVTPNAEHAIASKLAANASFQALFGDAASFFSSSNANHCKPLGMMRAQVDAQLPPLTLALGDGTTTIDLPATGSYLEVAESQGQIFYCPALFGVSAGPIDLGNSVVRSYVTIFDRAHQQMGFARAQSCP
jgi:hypothetical protein